MHPYQIANLLRRPGKERDMPIKVGSLYTVVRNLERHGFIEATGSHRAALYALDDDIAARRDALAPSEGTRPLFLIEDEYALEMRRAEAAWVRRLLAEITNGNFPDLAGGADFQDT